MDFEKLIVYQKAKDFYHEIRDNVLTLPGLEKSERDQLRRATLSISLNIAEGSSRFTNPARRNYYEISRGSAFEVSALFDHLKKDLITPEKLSEYKSTLEEISKMLFTMIKQLDAKINVKNTVHTHTVHSNSD